MAIKREDFAKLLQRAVQKDASDIHIKTGSHPYYRIDGFMEPQDAETYAKEDLDLVIDTLLTEDQKQYFLKRGEVDLAYNEKGVGRFRVNVFRQRGNMAVVLRRIKTKILNFEQLHLPPIVNRFAEYVRGMVLITGTTGSGKSTTLAAIIDRINHTRKVHVVTIEDPIEYIHNDEMAVVNQREVLIDTKDFSSALKSVMRQDPDVILVGEMRDLETFQAAMAASETGHLVFSTLHTANVMQTIDRIIDLYPADQQEQMRSQLSYNLQAVMCMRLIPRADGNGRVPACEVLLSTPSVRKLIKENRMQQLPLAIQQGRDSGMLSFNDSLHDLVKSNLVKLETAMEISDNPEELNMLLQGIRLSSKQGGILK